MARAFTRVWQVLNGPQELGRGLVFWCFFALVSLGLLSYPAVGSVFALSNLANFCLYVPMGLGLALLWGYNGVLSFGQSAFFAIAGYVYGIIAGNLLDMPGGTLLAAIAARAISLAWQLRTAGANAASTSQVLASDVCSPQKNMSIVDLFLRAELTAD